MTVGETKFAHHPTRCCICQAKNGPACVMKKARPFFCASTENPSAERVHFISSLLKLNFSKERSGGGFGSYLITVFTSMEGYWKGVLVFAEAVIQFRHHIRTTAGMLVLRDSKSPVVSRVLLGTPFQRSVVQIGHIPENAPFKKVVLHKSDKTFHLPLGKRVARLAEFCLETHGFHELLIILLPNRLALMVWPDHHILHVICENGFGNPHAAKSVNHADERVFLLGVGKELNIPLAAVVANHCKTRRLVLLAVIHIHCHEAPVHLVCLAGCSEIPAPRFPGEATEWRGAGTRCWCEAI